MPEYLYKCKNKHETTVIHGLLDSFSVKCPECDLVMWRVPQVFSVIWGGLPPHLEGTRPKSIQRFIDTADQRREQYIKDKEIYNTEKERIENG